MASSFAGKQIVVGVTGSIAAFKVAGWVSALAKEEALIDVVMTSAAQEFILPLTFAALTGRPVYNDMFEAERDGTISHIGLAREADAILVAPATANTIAKLAYGLADDLLSTTILAARVPVIICPAMNVKMFEHAATQKNIEILKAYGYRVIDPDCGVMACGEEGAGRGPITRQYADSQFQPAYGVETGVRYYLFSFGASSGFTDSSDHQPAHKTRRSGAGHLSSQADNFGR